MKMVVLIPHHRAHETLGDCIASVGDAPVVVVDDSPSGELELEGVDIVRTTGSLGFSQAVNLGLEHCMHIGFEHVLVLNDDARLRPGCIQTLQGEWMESDGAIAPVVHESDGTVFGICTTSMGRVVVRRTPGPVQAVSGAAIFLRSSERFDPLFVHGFEDVELCRRLRARGLNVRVIDKAHCDHDGGGTIERRSRRAQRHAMSGHLRFAQGPAQRAMAIALGVGQVVREGGPPQRLLGVVDGVLDHLRGGITPA
jgi:GT2 family glycosyltransferase